VNIRKKKENNFSILLRIFTNYIHIMTLSLSFNIELPPSFTGIFQQSDRFAAPSESFFSFDCFITDYDIKAFAPSNIIFKLFLFGLLPLILITFFVCVFFVYMWIVKCINPNREVDIKRYIVISMICIVFIFHPRMSLEALSMFQCQQIDENDSRMRLHMEYECYSSQHILWCVFVSLPMLAIWVIGMPLVAFLIMYRNRHSLEDMKIKKYFLVLYQGLKTDKFYWEFANTMRKVAIMMINILMFSMKAQYRIL